MTRRIAGAGASLVLHALELVAWWTSKRTTARPPDTSAIHW